MLQLLYIISALMDSWRCICCTGSFLTAAAFEARQGLGNLWLSVVAFLQMLGGAHHYMRYHPSLLH